MIKREITISYVSDGEVSIAALVVQRAGKFCSSIYLEQGTKRVNAKSIMGVMTMPIEKGQVFTISAEGTDEEAAVDDLEAFLAK